MMVIEYTLTRDDIAKAYSYNWKNSNRMRFVIISLALIVVVLLLLGAYLDNSKINPFDFIFATVAGITFVPVHRLLVRVMTKTQGRILFIDSEGIKTKVGSRSGSIKWSFVHTTTVTEDYIFIMGKNSNFFAIPNRAFLDYQHRNAFIELAKQYHQTRNIDRARYGNEFFDTGKTRQVRFHSRIGRTDM